jgi:cytoskeletal protein CcmA (bactofilin family)
VNEHVQDLRLVGTSEMAGGIFGKIRITGDAKLMGHVACSQLSLTGTAKLQGDPKAGRLKFTGELQVDGSLRGGILGGMGELRTVTGIRGEEIVLSGMLHSGGPIEAEKLDIRGAVETASVVNAERTTIRLYGPSQVGEIVGGTIVVRRSRGLGLKSLVQPSVETRLSAALIEGDEVYIEYTRADLVRGNTVKVGPGCEIGRIEYRQSFETHAKSKTGPAERL